ncbi:hypothetical protein HDV05_000415 [Chytridiales sp. JEL 0842]|nr:hypothetical protein HDV05_000415 [Chytridiales sp. JEL 0842]
MSPPSHNEAALPLSPPLSRSSSSANKPDSNVYHEISDPQTGRTFYANVVTGECSWEKPLKGVVKPKVKDEEEWWELFDDNHKLPYYYNTKTGATEWFRPTVGVIIPLAAIQNSAIGKRVSVMIHRQSLLGPMQFQYIESDVDVSMTGNVGSGMKSSRSGSVTSQRQQQQPQRDRQGSSSSSSSSQVRPWKGSMDSSNMYNENGSSHLMISTGQSNGMQDITTPSTLLSPLRPLPAITNPNLESLPKVKPEHMLPAELQRHIQQFQLVGFAQQYFAEHRKGIFRRKVPIDKMLRYKKDSLKAPLMNLPKTLHKDAVKCFKIIQRYMNDSWNSGPPYRNHTRDLMTLLEAGIYQGGLRDELYVQVCKQVTRNSSADSTLRGWLLFCILTLAFPPSKNLEDYMTSFTHSHATPETSTTLFSSWAAESPHITWIYAPDVLTRLHKIATYVTKKLQRICNKGPRGKVPSTQEIERAQEAPFHPSLFGETLEDIMDVQSQNAKDAGLPVPKILMFLADSIVNLNGCKTEGIFRVPGDSDMVNALRVKIERGDYSLGGITDPSVPSSLLKLWLRELAEPLIPSNRYDECIHVGHDQDHPEAGSVAKAIIQSLPAINRSVVLYMIKFLKLVGKEENIPSTRMTPANIALVFAPNFLRCPSDNPTVLFENTNALQPSTIRDPSYNPTTVSSKQTTLPPSAQAKESAQMRGAAPQLSRRRSSRATSPPRRPTTTNTRASSSFVEESNQENRKPKAVVTYASNRLSRQSKPSVDAKDANQGTVVERVAQLLAQRRQQHHQQRAGRLTTRANSTKTRSAKDDEDATETDINTDDDTDDEKDDGDNPPPAARSATTGITTRRSSSTSSSTSNCRSSSTTTVPQKTSAISASSFFSKATRSSSAPNSRSLGSRIPLSTMTYTTQRSSAVAKKDKVAVKGKLSKSKAEQGTTAVRASSRSRDSDFKGEMMDATLPSTRGGARRRSVQLEAAVPVEVEEGGKDEQDNAIDVDSSSSNLIGEIKPHKSKPSLQPTKTPEPTIPPRPPPPTTDSTFPTKKPFARRVTIDPSTPATTTTTVDDPPKPTRATRRSSGPNPDLVEIDIWAPSVRKKKVETKDAEEREENEEPKFEDWETPKSPYWGSGSECEDGEESDEGLRKRPVKIPLDAVDAEEEAKKRKRKRGRASLNPKKKKKTKAEPEAKLEEDAQPEEEVIELEEEGEDDIEIDDNDNHAEEEDPNKLYCYCRKPYNLDLFYIQCDSCDDWFCSRCTRLSEEKAEGVAVWFCKHCERERKKVIIYRRPCRAWEFEKECLEREKPIESTPGEEVGGEVQMIEAEQAVEQVIVDIDAELPPVELEPEGTSKKSDVLESLDLTDTQVSVQQEGENQQSVRQDAGEAARSPTKGTDETTKTRLVGAVELWSEDSEMAEVVARAAEKNANGDLGGSGDVDVRDDDDLRGKVDDQKDVEYLKDDRCVESLDVQSIGAELPSAPVLSAEETGSPIVSTVSTEPTTSSEDSVTALKTPLEAEPIAPTLPKYTKPKTCKRYIPERRKQKSEGEISADSVELPQDTTYCSEACGLHMAKFAFTQALKDSKFPLRSTKPIPEPEFPPILNRVTEAGDVYKYFKAKEKAASVKRRIRELEMRAWRIDGAIERAKRVNEERERAWEAKQREKESEDVKDSVEVEGGSMEISRRKGSSTSTSSSTDVSSRGSTKSSRSLISNSCSHQICGFDSRIMKEWVVPLAHEWPAWEETTPVLNRLASIYGPQYAISVLVSKNMKHQRDLLRASLNAGEAVWVDEGLELLPTMCTEGENCSMHEEWQEARLEEVELEIEEEVKAYKEQLDVCKYYKELILWRREVEGAKPWKLEDDEDLVLDVEII